MRTKRFLKAVILKAEKLPDRKALRKFSGTVPDDKNFCMYSDEISLDIAKTTLHIPDI